MSKIFLDTNILVYSMDQSHRARQEKCRGLLKHLAGPNDTGVLSTQVLQEFYVVCTKKLGCDPLLIKNILTTFENFEIVTIDPTHIADAIDCQILNKISFWDALIISSAASAKCEKIWTEDLNHGQLIGQVRVENPLL